MKTKNAVQPDAEAAKTSVQSSGLTAPKYVNPAGDEYPVIAVNGYDYPSKLGVGEDEIIDQLETISNCGFNATTWLCRGNSEIWRPYISTYLRVSASLGLRTIYMLQTMMPKVMQKSSDSSQEKDTTYDPTLEYIAEVLNLNKDDANLWGYKLCDEPGFNEWGYTTPTAPVGTRDLPAMYRTYLQNANGHIGYFTLAVSVAESYTGEKLPDNEEEKYMYRYWNYLIALNEKFHPSMLSVDIYPVFSEETPPIIKRTYYGYIEIIADFSTQNNIPFWMYMLSTEFTNYDEGRPTVYKKHPLPTEGVLLYQAMTALAYGFQGLVFWTYTLNKDQMQTDATTGEEIPKEKYILAPYMDEDGTLSVIWSNCAAVIPVIKEFGKILLGAKFIEAGHVYGPDYVSDPFPETTQFSSPIGCVSKATATGRGVVITRLEKGSEKFVAIVNHSPYDNEDFTLTISPRCKWTEYRMMDISDGYLTVTEHEREPQEKTISLYLQPGCMMLIKYEKD